MLERTLPILIAISRRLRLAMIALVLALAVKTGASIITRPEATEAGVMIETVASKSGENAVVDP